VEHVEEGAEVVVVVEEEQSMLVQTCSPRELHTQVLQSTVVTCPGVQVVVPVVVLVVVVVVVVVLVVVVLVVVAVVVELQSSVVQVATPSDPHTQVLQSCVKDVPGVQPAPWSAGHDAGQ